MCPESGDGNECGEGGDKCGGGVDKCGGCGECDNECRVGVLVSMCGAKHNDLWNRTGPKHTDEEAKRRDFYCCEFTGRLITGLGVARPRF